MTVSGYLVIFGNCRREIQKRTLFDGGQGANAQWSTKCATNVCSVAWKGQTFSTANKPTL